MSRDHRPDAQSPERPDACIPLQAAGLEIFVADAFVTHARWLLFLHDFLPVYLPWQASAQYSKARGRSCSPLDEYCRLATIAVVKVRVPHIWHGNVTVRCPYLIGGLEGSSVAAVGA
jgi:hypothetical protein